MRWLRNFKISNIHFFGAPVLVHSSIVFSFVFFLAIAVGDPTIAVAYILVFVGSVLLHEFGHAFVADRLGLRIFTIQVSWLHGLCEYEHPLNEWENVLVAWGGVLAQFAVAFIAWILLFSGMVVETSIIGAAVSFGFAINVIIPMFNLLPMHGYDGEVAWRILPLFRNQMKARQTAKKAISKLKK